MSAQRALALAQALSRARGSGAATKEGAVDRPRARARMVADLEREGVRDVRVLRAMGEVARHRFVPEAFVAEAYDARAALPIGEGQTISQPLTVARMSEALGLGGEERVLEVGTGSGYQAAVLGVLAAEVHSIERVPALHAAARERLAALGFVNVSCHLGDGTLGLARGEGFDAILVAAGGPRIPAPLCAALRDGGRLVVPVGERGQQRIVLVERRGEAFLERVLGGARFVDLVGAEGWSAAA